MLLLNRDNRDKKEKGGGWGGEGGGEERKRKGKSKRGEHAAALAHGCAMCGDIEGFFSALQMVNPGIIGIRKRRDRSLLLLGPSTCPLGVWGVYVQSPSCLESDLFLVPFPAMAGSPMAQLCRSQRRRNAIDLQRAYCQCGHLQLSATRPMGGWGSSVEHTCASTCTRARTCLRQRLDRPPANQSTAVPLAGRPACPPTPACPRPTTPDQPTHRPTDPPTD